MPTKPSAMNDLSEDATVPVPSRPEKARVANSASGRWEAGHSDLD